MYPRAGVYPRTGSIRVGPRMEVIVVVVEVIVSYIYIYIMVVALYPPHVAGASVICTVFLKMCFSHAFWQGVQIVSFVVVTSSFTLFSPSEWPFGPKHPSKVDFGGA